MSKSYELADGSLSTDYEIGDVFYVANPCSDYHLVSPAGGRFFLLDAKSDHALFESSTSGVVFRFRWGSVMPTDSTRQKVDLKKYFDALEQWQPRPFLRTGSLHKAVKEAVKKHFDFKGKTMNKFTKDDLKDGMRVTLGGGFVFFVCGDELRGENGLKFKLSDYTNDLLYKTGIDCNSIARVTDRDGTVLFERQPEKRKVTFELTEEQERELRKQLGQ